MTIYNPHLLARQDLIDTFVARQPLLDELIEDLRRGGGGHHLLIGGRGSGKTTLLLRLAAALEDDKRLTKKCIPLRFPEEQYNVSRASDFWMNAIDALMDALERQGDRATARHLETTLIDLKPLDEGERAKRSLAVLEGWARQTRRLIVLLVDNLDLVLDRLADSLWELREALSIDNRLVVVGASSRFLEEAIDYQSPFYDFFHVHELGPLSEDDARRVVLSRARRANTPRVTEILEHDPARFKALYVLTGGTPRTLALLPTVLALEHSDRIERDLDGLLDQLTPYYKARFDDLPSQSQVIVDKVALHWHPITAAECQAATHLDINVVSAQLNRLAKSTLLTKVSLPGPSKLGFQLSERFFNIWYLMRASRRLRQRLSWLVEFLRIFYGEEDLRRRAEELIRAAPRNSVSSPAKLLAFASAVPDESLRRQLELRAIALLAKIDIAAIREAIDLEGEDVPLAPVVDRVHALREIQSRITSIRIRWPQGLSASSVASRVVRDPLLTIASKQSLSRLVEEGNIDQLKSALPAKRDYSDSLGDRLLIAISTGEIPSLGDVRRPDDIKQIIGIAKSRSLTIALMLLATEFFDNPISDENVREMLHLDSRAAEDIIMATPYVTASGWQRVRHLVLLVIQHAQRTIELSAFIFFLQECVSRGRTEQALELLVETGLSERWAPLYEALRAVHDGSKTQLDRLAPEMRAVALDLYRELQGPDPGMRRDEADDPPGKDSLCPHTRVSKRAVQQHLISTGRAVSQQIAEQRKHAEPGRRSRSKA